MGAGNPIKYLVAVISAQKPASARTCAVPIHRLFGALLGLCCGAFAQGVDDAGTAEFQYLDILVFARPAGLAGAYTAAAQGVDAVGYNPAGVAKAEPGRTVSGTFRYHFLDIASGNASYAYPGETGAWNYAFSAAFINYGRIDEVDENGDATGKRLMPASFNPSFTAARPLNERTRVGATLKGFSEYLGDFEGSQLAVGWGIDLGMQYQPGAKNLGFGLALVNLGRKEQPHFTGGKTGGLLPAALKGGVFYSLPDLPKAKVVADAELPWHDAPRVSGGLEYAYAPGFILRAGGRLDVNDLAHYYDEISSGNGSGWQGGTAIKVAGGFTFAADGYAVDYAAQYWQGLSWVHALTLRYSVL
jgi:hypothetical protein